MTINTTSFGVTCSTEAEKDTLNTIASSIMDGTDCYCFDTGKTYKKIGGVWVLSLPSPTLQAQIDALVTAVALKADASTVGTISSTLTALASTVSGKADTSVTTAISAALTALTTVVAGKFTTPTGTTSQYVRGDGSLATLPVAAAWSQSAATHSIVTGTGATGFQVSSTRNSLVNYSTTIVTTASIGGNQTGVVVLEIAPTNSATPSDWVEVSRYTNGQALTLAITLQSVQTMSGQLSAFVPAGWYAKLRSINTSGTPSYSYNSGQETLV